MKLYSFMWLFIYRSTFGILRVIRVYFYQLFFWSPCIYIYIYNRLVIYCIYSELLCICNICATYNMYHIITLLTIMYTHWHLILTMHGSSIRLSMDIRWYSTVNKAVELQYLWYLLVYTVMCFVITRRIFLYKAHYWLFFNRN